MKKNKIRDAFLEHLRKIPIVQVACEKSGVSRNSVYRWKKEDIAFAKEMDAALKDGEELVSDMSESQLLNLIKEKNFPAIRFWLKNRSEKYKDRIEITTRKVEDELTPEQASVVAEALKLANLTKETYDTHTTI